MDHSKFETTMMIFDHTTKVSTLAVYQNQLAEIKHNFDN